MFRKLVRFIAYRIYQSGESQSSVKKKAKRLELINDAARVDPEALIESDALIQNFRGDPNAIRIGKKTQVRGNLMLFKHGGSIEIGDCCFIGPDTKIWSAKKVVIGNRVLIAHNVNIHDNISHPLNSLERHKDYLHIIASGFQENINLREEDIIIEDDVWVGFNCTILKGVRIGRGAIIGACTIITEDVPPYAVVVGNPPRIIKYVD
jgi:acetyltransferase-like isoleucine patch superfamily enzyme